MKRSVLSQVKPTAAEIEHAGIHPTLRVEIDIRVEIINDVLALLLLQHQASMAKNAEMMGDVGELFAEQFGQFAHVLGTRLQTLDDLEPVRFGEGFKVLGAFR